MDEGDSLAVRVLGTQAEQRRAMWQGTRRVLLLRMPSPVRPARVRLTSRPTQASSPPLGAAVARRAGLPRRLGVHG
ncbi:MAG: DUF3418 domain-containing protein [Egibacteraceae bacterium]